MIASRSAQRDLQHRLYSAATAIGSRNASLALIWWDVQQFGHHTDSFMFRISSNVTVSVSMLVVTTRPLLGHLYFNMTDATSTSE